MPLGLSLGIWPLLLIGMFPAVNGYFLIPNYGTIIAAMTTSIAHLSGMIGEIRRDEVDGF